MRQQPVARGYSSLTPQQKKVFAETYWKEMAKGGPDAHQYKTNKEYRRAQDAYQKRADERALQKALGRETKKRSFREKAEGYTALARHHLRKLGIKRGRKRKKSAHRSKRRSR